MLANFAVNIISVFIPLILYTYTGQIYISLLFLLVQYSLRLAFGMLFRKYIERRPQLYLLIRIVPMVLYALTILILDYNVWLGAGLIAVFGGLSDAFASYSNEIILNYSSLNRGGKSFGLTRLFEQVGVILSVLAGGLILDRLDKVVLIIISVSIYLLSVLPLVMYYFKYRKKANFNQEAISNAFLTYGQKQDKKAKEVSKKILLNYFYVYTLMCFIDAMVNIYNLYIFSTVGVFAFASLITATYNGTYGISSWIVGKINEKHDTTLMTTIACLIMAVLIVFLPFVQNEFVIIAIFGVIGGLYPFSSLLLIERMLVKTRILGISNMALSYRERGNMAGRLAGFATALVVGFVPSFFIIAGFFALFGINIPIVEEKTRKLLMKFLEGEG